MVFFPPIKSNQISQWISGILLLGHSNHDIHENSLTSMRTARGGSWFQVFFQSMISSCKKRELSIQIMKKNACGYTLSPISSSFHWLVGGLKPPWEIGRYISNGGFPFVIGEPQIIQWSWMTSRLSIEMYWKSWRRLGIPRDLRNSRCAAVDPGILHQASCTLTPCGLPHRFNTKQGFVMMAAKVFLLTCLKMW